MKKSCFIASPGGHHEQIRQLDAVAEKYNCYYVLSKNKSTKGIKDKKYLLNDYSRKNPVTFFLKEQPDVVITTGAWFAIPTSLYAHLFGRKLIYAESFARM